MKLLYSVIALVLIGIALLLQITSGSYKAALPILALSFFFLWLGGRKNGK